MAEIDTHKQFQFQFLPVSLPLSYFIDVAAFEN